MTLPGSARSPAHPRALERRDHIVGGDGLFDAKLPRAELVEQAQAGVEGAEVAGGTRANRRVLEPVRRAQHRLRERANGVDRRRSRPQRVELAERRAAELLQDGLDPLGLGHCPPAQAPLHEVDMRAGQARVGRAEKREEVGTGAVGPRVAEQREQRVPERRLGEAPATVERIGNPERPEGRLERRAPAAERRADDADRVRRRPAAHETEQLVADELERPADARALQERDGALERRRAGAGCFEQRALEVRECRRSHLAVRGRKLFDPAVREVGEVLGGALERREGSATLLVRQRHGDVGATGERLEQRPLGRGEVLEAVGEDGLAVPRVELSPQPRNRLGPKELPVPDAERVELGAVRRVQVREVALDTVGLEQRALELADRLTQRVGKPCGVRGRREAVQRRTRDGPPQRELLLRIRGERPRGAGVGDPFEDVVERADRAAEDAPVPGDELPLDPVDVRPARHDQCRLLSLRERGEIPLQEQRNLPRVRGADEQAQTHNPPIVERGPDGSGHGSPQSASNAGRSRPARRLSLPRPPSAYGRAWPPPGPASSRRRCRTGRPASSRGARR